MTKPVDPHVTRRRNHMDCEPDRCLLGDPSPCALFQPEPVRRLPRKKLVDRFEVLGVKLSADPKDPWDAHHYEGTVNGTNVRILTLHYETHLDARLGAQGLRIAGYSILGVRDLHTGKLVDDSEIKRAEIGMADEARWLR